MPSMIPPNAVTTALRNTSRRPNGPFLAFSARGYARARKRTAQMVPLKAGKQLQAPEADNKPKQAFLFGSFSGLHDARNRLVDSAAKAMEKIDSFDALRVFPSVRQVMVNEIKHGYNLRSTYISNKEELQIKPLPVQIAAIRKINQPRRTPSSGEKNKKKGVFDQIMAENEESKLKVFTVAAETGSGKTWAYLAPLLSKLKEADMAAFSRSNGEYREAASSNTIRSVIFLPTHELVEQVYDTVLRAASIGFEVEEKYTTNSEYAPFFKEPENLASLNLRVVKFGAGDAHTVLYDAVSRGRVDVLVTTPAKMESLGNLVNVRRPFRHLHSVEYCVVDEADTLMDKSWIADTTAALRRFPGMKDLVFCSATIPKEFNKTLTGMFRDNSSVINIVTPSLHKIPKQIVLKVIDAQQSPFNGSKTRCLAQALYSIHNDGTEQGHVKRILIFVNNKKDVYPLVDTLTGKYGHRTQDVIGITGQDSAEDRLAKLEPFLNQAQLLEDDPDASKIKVLVTTDLLARGLNFNGIKNVILMDLPNTSVDLVHRVGRTGRMKQSGRVFVIIDKKTRKSWIKGLPNAVKRGMTIG